MVVREEKELLRLGRRPGERRKEEEEGEGPDREEGREQWPPWARLHVLVLMLVLLALLVLVLMLVLLLLPSPPPP